MKYQNIDTTPPTCSEKGIEKGKKGNIVQDKQWYLENVTTYGYFTDENSGVTNEKQLSKELTETSENAQTSTITQTDNAGNEGSCVINNIYIDKTKPTCKTTGNSDKWVNTDVTLTGTCSDSGSGCSDETKTVTTTITNETNNKYSPGTVSDKAGNSSSCGQVQVKIDKTAPTCEVTAKGTKGDNGWYKSAVSFTITTSDESNGSGVSSAISPNAVENVSEKTVSGSVTDNAGNKGDCSTTVSSDSEAPTIDGCCGYNTRSYATANYSYGFACTNDNGTTHTSNGVSPFVYDYGPSGIADGEVTFYVSNKSGEQIAKGGSATRQIIGKRHFCIPTSEGTYESDEKQTSIKVVGLKDNAGNEASSGWIPCDGRSSNDPKYSGCIDWRETHKCTNKTDNGFVCIQPATTKKSDNTNIITVKGVN